MIFGEATRRVQSLPINGEFLAAFLSRGMPLAEVVKDGLPADARIIGCEWDNYRQRVVLFIHSEKYPCTSEGIHVPEAANPILSLIIRSGMTDEEIAQKVRSVLERAHQNTPAPAEV